MKFFATTLLVTVCFALAANAQTNRQIQLQVGDVDVKSVETEVQKTPQFEAGGLKGKNIPNPRDWLEVEAEFEVKGPSGAAIPELIFRFYVGFKDQTGQARVLTGDVTYTNVLVGEEMYSAVYVAPSTLGEITGDFRRFQESSIEAVGVEVIYNGVVVGGDSSVSGSNAKFWQAIGTMPGVLPKHETPFALLWLDRYPEPKISR